MQIFCTNTKLHFGAFDRDNRHYNAEQHSYKIISCWRSFFWLWPEFWEFQWLPHTVCTKHFTFGRLQYNHITCWQRFILFLLLIIFAKITNIRLVLVILYADNFFALIIFCDYVISGVARNYVWGGKPGCLPSPPLPIPPSPPNSSLPSHPLP